MFSMWEDKDNQISDVIKVLESTIEDTDLDSEFEKLDKAIRNPKRRVSLGADVCHYHPVKAVWYIKMNQNGDIVYNQLYNVDFNIGNPNDLVVNSFDQHKLIYNNDTLMVDDISNG